MTIEPRQVKELRDMTGAGMMEAKKALEEAHGDRDKAIAILRMKGKKIASQKAARTASEGYIGAYLHSNGKVAAMVEVNCETDFVARTDDFKQLARDLAMQVAAMNPTYLSPEEVPDEVKEKEREIYRAEMKDQKKPDNVLDKIIDGKLEKFYSQACLMKQPYIKDDAMTVEKLVHNYIATLGENIKIKRFARFDIS